MMKYKCSGLIMLLVCMVSCKEEMDIPDTVDQSLFEYLQEDPNHQYFVNLMEEYMMDSLENGNIYTFFIPDEEDLQELNQDSTDFRQFLSYLMTPTYVSVNSIRTSEKIQTLLDKFALLEWNKSTGAYTFDGVEITEGSPIFRDGRFYSLSDLVYPPDNIYEYITKNSPLFKNFIDLQDSVYFDPAESTPIAFSEKGTIYDSVFTSVNLFSRDFFPVEEEFRSKSATLLLFTQEQLDDEIEFVKSVLNVNEIPDEWINNTLMPSLINFNIFKNSLQYEEFEPRMVNIKGDSIDVDINNFVKDSRTICSNGIVYKLSNFSIPDSLYKSQNVFRGMDAAEVVIENEKWDWSEDMTLSGLEGSNITPTLVPLLDVSGEQISTYPEVLRLNLDAYEGNPGDLRISFKFEGVFGAENYRLVWKGSKKNCGLWKIYVNGVALEMRNVSGKTTEYFDSYLFGKSVIRNTTTASRDGNFRGTSGYNGVDFKINNLLEYGDAIVSFEYHGPSILANGLEPSGIIIDYILLEIY